jgi:hypothetical protein
MTDPTIIAFSRQLEDACNSIEHSAGQLVDALRWRACLEHGFPSINVAAKTKDTLWMVGGKYYGANPTSAIDAILRTEYASDTAN